jgi:hypothetical protein
MSDNGRHGKGSRGYRNVAQDTQYPACVRCSARNCVDIRVAANERNVIARIKDNPDVGMYRIPRHYGREMNVNADDYRVMFAR